MGVCSDKPEESLKVPNQKSKKTSSPRPSPKPSPKGRRSFVKPLITTPRKDDYINKAIVAKANEVMKQNQRELLEMSF